MGRTSLGASGFAVWELEGCVLVAAVVVAAGRGSRMADVTTGPKQYADLHGKTILRRTLDALFALPDLGAIQVVIHPDDQDAYRAATKELGVRLLAPVFGGSTRQASVVAGLNALAANPPDVVLIHDAARPFITVPDVDAVIAAAANHGAAIAATPVVDTLKQETQADDGGAFIATTVPRDGLWRALTPQAFRYRDILDLHERAGDAEPATDDAALFERAGRPVALVAASPANFKITTPEDLAMAQERIGAAGSVPDVRTGTGFDVHRFAPGDSLWLCGIEIPHTATLEGHSDADVGLHALTDAILGAISDGDIGAHFPPSDPQWKGAASDQFLAHAAGRLRARGGRLLNVDLTLLCEAPKIGPHREAMRARIAEILDLDFARVGVKATTTERLGFTGRKEGIAAMASATAFLGFL